MSESDRHAAFLKQVICYGATEESVRLKERITQAEAEERCVHRALNLAILLITLAAAGLACWAALWDESASNTPWSARHVIANCLCGLGLGSLISILVFIVLGAVYHRRAGQRREEGRQFAEKLLETRLGKPAIPPRYAPSSSSGATIPNPRNHPSPATLEAGRSNQPG
jgi:hypothetical protein